MKSEVVKVLRVGVANNYNYTEAEEKAVESLKWGDKVFVNSNSFVTVNSKYPSFLTINPYLDSFVEPTGDLSQVKACRVKYVEDARPDVYKAFEDSIKWCIDRGIPVLVTFMRFSCKNSLKSYTNNGGALDYKFKGSYYRLTEESKARAVSKIYDMLEMLDGDPELLNFCDLSGEGCPSCGNCAKLAFNIEDEPYELYGVSLKESGDGGKCVFHCPDCWAHRIEQYCKPAYGKITQNSKQRGYHASTKKGN